jgi:hypothetical protein
MKNLAGNKLCDSYITEELCLAKIPVIHLNERTECEVPYSVTGNLNGFTFRRAWYYWIVEGNMPLYYAQKLYNENYDLMIRVDGHCGNISPDGRSEPKSFKENVHSYADKYFNSEISLDEYYYFAEKIRNEGEQFIKVYHIDTQEGLNKFAETIIENDIHS